MSAIELMARLRALGAELWIEGAQLRYMAPRGVLTPSLRAEIALVRAELVELLRGSAAAPGLPLHPVPRSGEMPLSFAQQRLWFVQQLDPDSPFYNVPAGFRIEGKLNLPALEQAFNEIVRRHEALRTVFPSVNGKPVQVIRPILRIPLPVTDLSHLASGAQAEGLSEFCRASVRRPFDLVEGPLLRCELVRFGAESHALILTMHHLVADAWSMRILGRELAKLYEAQALGVPHGMPDLAIQYADFAYWQRRWVQSDELKAQLAYWVHQLGGAPPSLNLPTDRPRPAKQTFRGEIETAAFPQELTRALDALSRHEGVTLFMTLLAGLALLLHRYTGQYDIVVATPVSNRSRTELEGLIGTFMNTLALRIDFSGNPTFREILGRVRKVAVEGYDNQDIPFDRVVEELRPERSLSHAPLFQVLFLLEGGLSSFLQLPDLRMTPVDTTLGTARFDLLLFMDTTAAGLAATLEYATDIFDRSTIRRMLGHFRTLLECAAASPDQLASDLALVDLSERQTILSGRDDFSVGLPLERTIHQAFESQAARSPDADAVVHDGRRLTYRELDLRADRLAGRLRTLGVAHDAIVGLCVERSVEMIIGLLGILKAGGAYLPLDPTYPQDRLAFILKDASPLVIVTTARSAGALPEHGIAIQLIDAMESLPDVMSDRSWNDGVSSDNLAYVIYTSGSTGAPHGVMVPHGAVMNLSAALTEVYPDDGGAPLAVGVNGSFAFDTSVKQIVQLLRGHTLHIIPDPVRLDPRALIAFLRTSRIDVLDCTPSQCELLLGAGLTSEPGPMPARILVGGDSIGESAWKAMRQAGRTGFYNVYGPTECTVDATACPIGDGPQTPSIGRPIANVRVYVLDRRVDPVPTGMPGEIYIGGAGVSRGYLGQPGLTAERFLPDPFADTPGARMYRSGDLGRRSSDGNLVFLGRNDRMVKLRGVRIELGEVEAILGQHPDVREVAAQLRDGEAGEQHLVAYVVPSPQRSRTIAGHSRRLLKNNMAVLELNRNETSFLYTDIFENHAYLKHGITIADGACVFDVGANIGLFSLFAHHEADGVRVFAFEPNLVAFDLLRSNLALYGVDAALFNCGLAATDQMAEFSCYEKFSILSGFYAQAEDEKALVRSYIRRQLRGGETVPMADSAEERLDEPLEKLLDDRLQESKFPVRLRTLSDILLEHRIERVDLLKINVEKSELDVINGIHEEDWIKIRQVVLELHDLDGRLEYVTSMLECRGYHVTSERDWSLDETTNVYYVYGVRGNPRLFRSRSPDRPTAALRAPFLASTELRRFAEARLPKHTIPSVFAFLDKMPLTAHGKTDHARLPSLERITSEQRALEDEVAYVAPQTEMERSIASIWQDVLRIGKVGLHENFFDLGGHSLLLVQVHERIRQLNACEVSILELFEYPTVSLLAGRIAAGHAEPLSAEELARRHQESWHRSTQLLFWWWPSFSGAPARLVDPAERRWLSDASSSRHRSGSARPSEGSAHIAVIGMAGRFPGAPDIQTFWENLKLGKEAISIFSDEELAASGVDPAAFRRSDYVRARAVLDDVEMFDAGLFGINPREAEILDPQHRLFLECAWEGLETAGYDAAQFPGEIGVFAGSSMSTYLLFNLFPNLDLIDSVGLHQTAIANDKDHLATLVSYKLGLKGPSVAVQTACSTSLVAVQLACQSLLAHQCNLALAGGVSVSVPRRVGYRYQEGGIFSPDGRCRAFDASARGTVGGEGVGVVVLKRLSDAILAGDHIHGVILGSAVNNDGNLKVGYTAPSVQGQAEVVERALSSSGVDADTIGYVEAHGTGTRLGDPIEIAALTEAFRRTTDKTGFCAIGSVKTNIGHLDAAAGVAGLIKAVLAVEHGVIPPSLHFETPNPAIDFAGSPFHVNQKLREWPAAAGHRRRAGVSSFGIGGTNAHVVVEAAAAAAASGPSRPWQLLVLSAATEPALEAATARLGGHLRDRADQNLADVAFTLQQGRRVFGHRRVAVCSDRADAIAVLSGSAPDRLLTAFEEGHDRPVGFLFPGQGTQHVRMGFELYGSEAVFRSEVDRCAEALVGELGLDLREVLFPAPGKEAAAAWQLQQTQLTQPALFVICYALARLWMGWGVRPSAMLGHSLGEYVAACLAEVFSLEDALRLVVGRARLMQGVAGGAMLAVSLSAAEVERELTAGLSVSAENGPGLCVVGGPEDAVEGLAARLAVAGVVCHRLATSHAFHSAMMDPICGAFAELVETVERSPPRLPYVSNVTGGWITSAEVTSTDYWVEQLRRPVRFGAGLATLTTRPELVLLEVGPGRTLSGLARQQPSRRVVSSLPKSGAGGSDGASILEALGRLWQWGVAVDWSGFAAAEHRGRVALPTYPFERQRYWIEPLTAAAARPAVQALSKGAVPGSANSSTAPAASHRRPDIATAYVSLDSDVEHKVAAIWQQLLGIDKIGRYDDFFELGGHSLLAAQLIARVRDVCAAEVPLAYFFEHPTVAGLADAIGEVRHNGNGGGLDNAIRRIDLSPQVNIDYLSDAEVDAMLSELRAPEGRIP
ncbi:amino acid adenylation domain-containing protein (plasmid) [Bradyrhizobium sp. LCT2]|uniref:non-ribosomal peptide synthetase/type I polyketide synthase n=1 Tax=Bradyrhizobium sp. LCT2 TaxID=2493093 RepID=UPI0013746CB6|nr:non-ribosomal peptide synthetase/type I polyketide synthase [Bradyrhizobium sp. LCT2]QHP66039.1 amino acid adenylation domain-containing protein [Bradyrhizobium sp. LCT2]